MLTFREYNYGYTTYITRHTFDVLGAETATRLQVLCHDYQASLHSAIKGLKEKLILVKVAIQLLQSLTFIIVLTKLKGPMPYQLMRMESVHGNHGNHEC